VIPSVGHSFQPSLKQWVKANHLQGATADGTLHPKDYQLFLLDRPKVPETEIISALRWQIRSWIPFPAKDAAIQYFSVPTEGRIAPKIYACVANLEKLKQWHLQLEEAGLKLTQLNIVELTLSKLLNQFSTPSIYCGMLFQKEEELQLLVVQQNQLVFIRNFSIPLSAAEDIGQAVQESFLYCQSHRPNLRKKLFLHASVESLLPFLKEKRPELSTERFPQDERIKGGSIDELISITSWITQDERHAED
jgi:hypothetical protein